jgi:hypothetical protein
MTDAKPLSWQPAWHEIDCGRRAALCSGRTCKEPEHYPIAPALDPLAEVRKVVAEMREWNVVADVQSWADRLDAAIGGGK